MKNLEGSIITYTGRLFWPLDPNIDDINLLDICHALSNQCRFTGHTRSFYSVGEHSCRAFDIVSNESKKPTILHDASEAYLMDLARPVKNQDSMILFREAEDRLMNLIAEKFEFEYPLSKEVKWADTTLLVTEYRDLMTHNKLRENDFNGYKPLEQIINPWTPAQAKSGMMERLEKLGLEVNR